MWNLRFYKLCAVQSLFLSLSLHVKYRVTIVFYSMLCNDQDNFICYCARYWPSKRSIVQHYHCKKKTIF